MYTLTLLASLVSTFGAYAAFSAGRPILGSLGVIGALFFFVVDGDDED